MFDFSLSLRALTVASSLALATSAMAQTATTTEAPAEAPATTATEAAPAAPGAAPEQGLSMGQEANAGPQTYVKQEFESWQLTCVKVTDGKEPCQLYQLLKDQKGTATAEISMVSLPEGGQAAAGATIITPLETLLPANITLQIDTAKPKSYPFTFCSAIGCVSRVGFTKAEIDALKKGAKATMIIVPAAAPKQTVVLDISLKGFTAGFDAVAKENQPG